jgi:hypothetical protein
MKVALFPGQGIPTRIVLAALPAEHDLVEHRELVGTGVVAHRGAPVGVRNAGVPELGRDPRRGALSREQQVDRHDGVETP